MATDLVFRRGDAVQYFGGGAPEQLFWGAKMGRYRVLSHDPRELAAGFCVPELALATSVFPAPAADGTFQVRHCRVVAFQQQALVVRLYAAPAGPHCWVAGRRLTVNGRGVQQLPSIHGPQFASFEAAVTPVAQALMQDLAPLACGGQPRVKSARVQAAARAAVDYLLLALPATVVAELLAKAWLAGVF